MKTFDRYLLTRYLHVVAVFLIAAVGLFAVVDGFMNLDAFQEKAGSQGALALLTMLLEHYLFQSALIVDLAGPTVMVLSAMCVLALMLRQGEIHPLLAAGVPTYRLTLPLMSGVILLNLLLAGNQEFILPRIAPHLQTEHGDSTHDAQAVQPRYDSQWIFVSAQGALPAERMLTRPEFILPAPSLVADYVTLRAGRAQHVPAGGNGPAGWLLMGVEAPLDESLLTETGRQVIIPQESGGDIFVASSLTLDQLSRQASNHRLIGTADILARLRQPTGSLLSRRALLVHLHDRLTRPVLTLIGLYLVIPLIVRRDRMSAIQQVTNIAVCSAVLGVIFGLTVGSQFLGQAGAMRPEQSVWAPLVFSGGLAAWLSGVVRS